MRHSSSPPSLPTATVRLGCARDISGGGMGTTAVTSPVCCVREKTQRSKTLPILTLQQLDSESSVVSVCACVNVQAHVGLSYRPQLQAPAGDCVWRCVCGVLEQVTVCGVADQVHSVPHSVPLFWHKCLLARCLLECERAACAALAHLMQGRQTVVTTSGNGVSSMVDGWCSQEMVVKGRMMASEQGAIGVPRSSGMVMSTRQSCCAF